MSDIGQRLADEIELGGDASTLETVVHEWVRDWIPDAVALMLTHPERRELLGPACGNSEESNARN